MAMVSHCLWLSVTWYTLMCTSLIWVSLSSNVDVDADVDGDGDVWASRDKRSAKKDRHGGVPMGLVVGCDDAQTSIEVDWNPNSTKEYTCEGNILRSGKTKVHSHCEEYTSKPTHICLPLEIHYEDPPPTSGKHRPSWARYGEYTYVPPQRWLHNLEHGGIVMLYHPCADPEEVEALRRVVRGCLRKHVITPSLDLPRDTPLALLSWGCRVMMSRTLSSVARNFIESHANKGPEGNVGSDGHYKVGLLIRSETVSDFHDTHLCPSSNLSSSVQQQNLPTQARPTSLPQQLSHEAEPMKANADNMTLPLKMSQATATAKESPAEQQQQQQQQRQQQQQQQQPVNAIVKQSNLRRQRLAKKARKEQEAMQRLTKAYRKLLSPERKTLT